MQTALHQQLSFALLHQLNRERGCVMAVLGRHQLDTRQVNTVVLREAPDTFFWPDEYRLDKSRIGGIQGALQGHRVTGMNHRRRHRV